MNLADGIKVRDYYPELAIDNRELMVLPFVWYTPQNVLRALIEINEIKSAHYWNCLKIGCDDLTAKLLI